MTRPLFIFIESNTTGTGPLFLAAANELGFEPVLIASNPGRYPQLARSSTTHVADTSAGPAVLLETIEALARGRTIGGVYSSSDYFLEVAATLASRLGAAGAAPDAIACCRNKRLQRHRLRAAGVPAPAFVAVRSGEDFGVARRALTPPVVVKPVAGSGSVGVRLCATDDDVFEYGTRLLDQRVNERGLPVPREILVEEYVEGAEFSVEMMSGSVVGVTRKHLSPHPTFVEIGHDYPASLDERDAGSIRDVARRALAAVGLSRGPAHVELRLSARGPQIIEINARLAGGFIPELVRQAGGIDLVLETVRWASGADPRLEPRDSRCASIRFIMSSRAGVISRVDGVDRAATLPHVTNVRMYKSVGDAADIFGDFRDRVGHVICAGARAGDVAAAAEAARDVVTITVGERIESVA